MKTQRRSFNLAAAVLLVLAAAPARADWPEIQKRGRLRVLAVRESLFFSLEPDAPPGFDRELLEGFCQLHKLKLEVVAQEGWKTIIPALLDGKGDVIAGGYAATEARRKLIDFTVEVFPARKVVFTRKPHRVVESVAQLREEKVGTVRGTSMEEAVKEAGVPEANIEYVPAGTLPAGLRSGAFGAGVLGVEHVIVEQRADPGIQFGLFLGQPGIQAFGLRKGDRVLKAVLDDYIENIRRTPIWARLVVKYLGEAAPEILRKAREK